MSDMYGAIRSNWFRVKDFDSFKSWFDTNVMLGQDIRVLQKDGLTSIAGYEMYPSAYPQQRAEEQLSPWELDEFAKEIRKHLEPGEEFRVLSAGHENLRYVIAEHLVISHSTATFTSLYEGN